MNGYLDMTRAAARLGVSRPTMIDRVRAFDLPVFRDPRDYRRRLLRVEDVDRLRQLAPVHPAPTQPVSRDRELTSPSHDAA